MIGIGMPRKNNSSERMRVLLRKWASESVSGFKLRAPRGTLHYLGYRGYG